MHEELVTSANHAYALAVQLTGNTASAEDIVHDAIVKVLRKPRAYDPKRGTFRAWFATVVRNLAYDQHRRKVETSDAVDPLIDANSNPEQSAISNEQDQLLVTALNDLAQEHREILVLRDYSGFAYDEIARVLNIPKGTVMSRIHRARSALHKRLVELEP